jgi:hypothetical protein
MARKRQKSDNGASLGFEEKLGQTADGEGKDGPKDVFGGPTDVVPCLAVAWHPTAGPMSGRAASWVRRGRQRCSACGA